MSFVFRKSKSNCPQMQGPEGCATCTLSGLTHGTRVLTSRGWEMVESLKPGALIRTLDRSMETVTEIQKHQIWKTTGHCPNAAQPFFVPAGTIGNETALWLTPDSRVMITPPAELTAELPPALLDVADLDQFRGICRAQPPAQTALYTVHVDAQTLICVSGGAWIAIGPAQMSVDVLMTEAQQANALPVLDHEQADAYLMIIEDVLV